MTGSTAVAAATGVACPVCGGTDSSFWLQAPDRFHLRNEMWRLWRCSACGLAWLNNPPALEQMAEHYGSEYHASITTATEGATLYWKGTLARLARYKTGGRILDVGCSSGSFLRSLDRRAWQLFGIEISPHEADAAREATGAEVFCGDVLSAPFPKGSFDAIVCFHVMEHMFNAPQVMGKIYRWLAPGGVCYITVPNIDSWDSRLFRSYWYGLELPRHLFHFSPRSLGAMAERSGLRVEELHTGEANFLEQSLRYVSQAASGKIGIQSRPLASDNGGGHGFVFRALRKLCRVAMLQPFARASVVAGAGSVIIAVFRKPAQPEADGASQ
jgi:SAM-dependent methyltransferase